jgi:Photoprotection regulator fluorescence recovery protein
LQQLVREAKATAASINEPSESWKLERWRVECRAEIDRKYYYRYSMLPMIFAQLLKQGRIAYNDLQGLAPEKIEVIRGVSRL